MCGVVLEIASPSTKATSIMFQFFDFRFLPILAKCNLRDRIWTSSESNILRERELCTILASFFSFDTCASYAFCIAVVTWLQLQTPGINIYATRKIRRPGFFHIPCTAIILFSKLSQLIQFVSSRLIVGITWKNASRFPLATKYSNLKSCLCKFCSSCSCEMQKTIESMNRRTIHPGNHILRYFKE